MEGGQLGDGWYFTREEIEKFSPSRKHGIDAKRENNLRKSYCSFIREVGVRLKLPQVAIATAIVFCHRFYLRQSHQDYDRYTVATACVFLSGKVEENPKSLMTVIQLAYEIRHKRDPTAKERIKEKEVYGPQKDLIVMAERVVLSTLAYDLNMQHPYKFIVSAIKNFKVSESSLAQVAWNFVNDGLITTLCLQYKPQHIAAGALFLGAKFLKVTLPSNEKPWWQEFDVNPRQLEDVSNQMLELYEQSKTIAASASNDISSSQELILSRQQPDSGHSAGRTTDIPITTIVSNTNTTGTNGTVGQDNQGLAIPKPVRNRNASDAKEHGYLPSMTVQVDNHEIINDKYLKMSSTAESGATSSGGTLRLGNKRLLEQTCTERTDYVEERKRKKSRWDAAVGEPSTVTSVDEQVKPTIRGMVLK